MYDPEKISFGVSGIYRIKNIKNNKFYIGSAKCLRKRFNDHINKLKNNKHPNQYLQNAFDKFGLEAFQAELLEKVNKLENLILIEQRYLNEVYDNQKLCYNICPIAGSALGRKHSFETKQKISNAHKGKKVSKETKEKISKAKKKQRHLHFKKGKENPMWNIGHKHPMYGKTHKEESKKKMSLSSKGKPNHKNGKMVAQYDLNGVLIKQYISCAEAQRQTGILGIRACARGFRKSAGGFCWKYVNLNL